MTWLILIGLAIVALGMYGGQRLKGTRRFGIPFLSFFSSIFVGGFRWKNLSILLFIPVLVLGYGQNSWLYERLGNDTLVRLVYSLMLAVPFIFDGIGRLVISAVCLVAVFQVHAGSLFSISGFDFLIEDFLRYGMLAVLIILFKIKSVSLGS